MFPIYSKKKSNISNIIIKSDFEESNTIFDFSIKYINNFEVHLQVNIVDGDFIKIYLINKNNESDYHLLTLDKNGFNEVIKLPFEIIQDNSLTYYNIPKIIHQSYKRYVKKNLYNAINSWKQMNINYEYMYWDDDDCYKFIKENFDENVLDAYNTLYAGAYKSDIFRLCVLYKYGGIWTDISSTSEINLDKIIDNNNNLIIVKDHPSQIYYGNIYNAFIVSDTNNEIIKYVLNFTVDRVLHHQDYNGTYPHLANQTIGVTGPTVFATAFNKYFNRKMDDLINDISIHYAPNNFIKFLDHYPGIIKMNNIKIINTKYNNWQEDRTNTHYSNLFQENYIYKRKINDIIRNSDLPSIYQTWIQSNFVSENMYNAVQSVIQNNSIFNYQIFTNEKIIELLENQFEFPLLHKAYNKLKPYAFKSDLIRYYLLYKYGGVYIDIDAICLNSIAELYYDYDLVFCKDLNSTSISNGFICAKKNNQFFKYLIVKIVDDIINDVNYENDMFITGPGVLGECFSNYFNLNKNLIEGNYNINNIKIKLIKHSLDLPIPKGRWEYSSRNFSVKNNILTAECESTSGEWIQNKIKFSVGDNIENLDGKLVNNTHFEYDPCEGCTLVYDELKIYIITKYSNYNNERLILNGNNFAEMFMNNDIINR
jgi:mannosyltransferase OCH1-like enzyme